MGKKRRRDTVASRRVVSTSTVPSSSSSSSSSRKKKKMKMMKNPHPSISISKLDHDTTLHLLQSMNWEMAQNTSRRNVIRSSDAPRNARNTPYCQSFIFGPNMKDPQKTPSYWSTQYPAIYTAFRGLMNKYDPNFRYTHITVNKNLRCKRHTDGGNAGLSYIAGFGNYIDGQLLIVEEDEQHSTLANSSGTAGSGEATSKPKEYKLDLKSKFVLFNGKTQPHETCAFSGDRYTLVYYTSEINNTKDNNNIVGTTDYQSTATKISRSSSSSSSSSSDGISPSLAMKFQQMKAKLNKKFK